MAGATMDFTPYHYCYSNPINFIDPSGMYAYNWNTGQYENSKGEVVSWNEVKSNNFKEPPTFDLWGGLRDAWNSFWGNTARDKMKYAETSEVALEGEQEMKKSMQARADAAETIETVNMVLITSATVLTGYGVAAEGGFVVSRLYAVVADATQQGLIKGDISEIDFANSLIAGVGGNMALNELFKTVIDWKPGDPMPSYKKDLIEIGTEYGLRLTLNKVKIKGKDAGLKFGVQLFGKAFRDEFQQPIIDDIKSLIE